MKHTYNKIPYVCICKNNHHVDDFFNIHFKRLTHLKEQCKNQDAETGAMRIPSCLLDSFPNQGTFDFELALVMSKQYQLFITLKFSQLRYW